MSLFLHGDQRDQGQVSTPVLDNYDYGTKSSMKAENYWREALPTYLRLSVSFGVMVAFAPLVVAVLASIWTGIRTGHWPTVGLAFALILGGFFFVLSLVTAIVEDMRRNWRAHIRTTMWNTQLVWRNFIYLGAAGFFIAAFLAYHQGVWLTVFFLAFSVGSLLTARKCF
jgi:hypothetical protein